MGVLVLLDVATSLSMSGAAKAVRWPSDAGEVSSRALRGVDIGGMGETLSPKQGPNRLSHPGTREVGLISMMSHEVVRCAWGGERPRSCARRS